MSSLPITLTVAGAAALMNIWLGLRITLLRRGLRISIGDNGNPAIAARIRAHGNFIEYTPFFLILLAAAEFTAGSPTWLWILALVYMVGRLLHVFGMDRGGANMLRAIGIISTWLCLLVLAGYAIFLSYQATQRPHITYAEARASAASPTNGLVRRS